MNFRVVQPWGPDKGRQGTVQSEHKTVAEAFAALDSIATDMAQTGAMPSNSLSWTSTGKWCCDRAPTDGSATQRRQTRHAVGRAEAQT